MAVVSNSSPLIAFAAIGQLHLFPAMFSSLAIPPAVVREITPSIPILPPWLLLQPLKASLPAAVLRRSLGDGEREALALAAETQADRTLLDDRAARRVAAELKIPAIGTAGLLLAAKRQGLIPRIRPHVDALIAGSFFIGPDLYEELLRLAGESNS